MLTATSYASTELVSIEDGLSIEALIHGGGNPGVVRTIDDRKNTLNETDLPPRMADIRVVRSFRDKIVVLGKDQYSDLMVVYDRKTLDILDYIRGRQITLSPSGRFAVYERYFAPRGPAEYHSHLTLLYDLVRSPEDNRTKGSTPISFERPNRETAHSTPSLRRGV